MRLKYTCDRCLKQLGTQEDMFSINLVDDSDVEKTFKGHEDCMQEIADILKQLYGKKDKE